MSMEMLWLKPEPSWIEWIAYEDPDPVTFADVILINPKSMLKTLRGYCMWFSKTHGQHDKDSLNDHWVRILTSSKATR